MGSSDKKGRIAAILLGVIDIACLIGVIILAAGGHVGAKEIKPGLEKHFVESPADYASEKTDEVRISDIRLGEEKKGKVLEQEKKKADEAETQERKKASEKTDEKSDEKSAQGQTEKKPAKKPNPYAGFVFPDSNKVVISLSDIKARLTSKDKYLQAVNELYARYGYAFKEEPFKSFFEGYAWYRNMEKVSMKAVEKALTAVERENLRNLLAFGREKGWR